MRPYLLGGGGSSTLPRRATLDARWLHEPQPISNPPVGLGFPHRAGRYRPVGSPLSPAGCWSRRDMEEFQTREKRPYHPRVRRDLDVVPSGNSRRTGCMSPSQSATRDVVGVSTPCGVVTTRGICVFVPGLLEMQIYGRICDRGIGAYPPRVRRDPGIDKRCNSRRALAP